MQQNPSREKEIIPLNRLGPFHPRRVLWIAFTTASVSLILVVLVFFLHYQGCPIALPTTGVLQFDRQAPLSNLQELGNGGCSSQQKGYHAVTCPVWYDEADPPFDLDPISQDRGIDYRVRYLHKRQNPQGDCMEQNYYTKGFRDMSIFNSFKLLLARGLFAATLTDRIFVLPAGNQFNYGDEKRYDAIFEPLSKCTGEHAESLKQAGHPHADLEDNSPSRSLLLNDSLRVLDDVAVQGLSYHQIFEGQGPRPPFPDLMQFSEEDDVHAGLLLYTLRLNPAARKKMEAILADSLPCDFEPSRTISLPIRGSDKCRGPMHLGENSGESDCLDFDVYMQAAELIRENDPRVNTIILTSEDARYLSHDRSGYIPRWRFIVNNYDIMPSTGLGHSALREFAKERNESMDSMLFSALSSFQLQMRGKYFIINCDSGIHKIIGKLATNGGCSLAQNPRVYCLQDQIGEMRMCKMFDAPCFKEKYNVTISQRRRSLLAEKERAIVTVK